MKKEDCIAPYVGYDVDDNPVELKQQAQQLAHKASSKDSPELTLEEQSVYMRKLGGSAVEIIGEIIEEMRGRAQDPDVSLKDLAYAAKTLFELRKQFFEVGGSGTLERLRATLDGPTQMNFDSMFVNILKEDKPPANGKGTPDL